MSQCNLTSYGPFLVALMVCATAAACGPSHIETVDGLMIAEGAEILDTEQNREILTVVTSYQEAMEARDIESIKNLISDEYYENAGTTDRTEDDYGHAGIATVLDRFKEHVKSVHFDVVVQEVRVEGDRAQVFYEYSWNFLYEIGEVPRWEAGRDINRMDLVQTSGRWRITRGL